MDGVRIIATPEGLDQLNIALGRLVALGVRPRPLWQAVAQYGESSTRLRFRKQIGPDGARWKPSHRAMASGPGRTLIKTSRLLRSITNRADDSGAEWGTNVIYARPQQFGAVIKAKGKALRFRVPGGGFVTVKKVTLPARPFLGVNEEDGREIVALAGDVLDEVQRAG